MLPGLRATNLGALATSPALSMDLDAAEGCGSCISSRSRAASSSDWQMRIRHGSVNCKTCSPRRNETRVKMDGRVQDLRLGRLWSSSVRNAAQHRSDFATVGPWIGREGFLGFLRQFLDALQELRDGRHLDSPHQAPTKRRHAFSEMHHSGSRAIRCPPPKRSQSSLFPRKYGICNRLPPIALPSIRSRQSRSGDSGTSADHPITHSMLSTRSPEANESDLRRTLTMTIANF